MDWFPSFLAAAGDPDIKTKLLMGGVKAIGRTYKVHLDGYNILPLLTGQTQKSPRNEIFFFSDDGDLTALRYRDWKLPPRQKAASFSLDQVMEKMQSPGAQSGATRVAMGDGGRHLPPSLALR